jgi:hypothetical protein
VAAGGALRSRIDIGDDIFATVRNGESRDLSALRGGAAGTDAVFVVTGVLRSVEGRAETPVRGCELARWVDGCLLRRRMLTIGLGDVSWDEPAPLPPTAPRVTAAGRHTHVRWTDPVERGWETWTFTTVIDANGPTGHCTSTPVEIVRVQTDDRGTVVLHLNGARVTDYQDVPADLRVVIARERPEFAFAPGPLSVGETPSRWIVRAVQRVAAIVRRLQSGRVRRRNP